MNLHSHEDDLPSWDEITALMGEPDIHPEQPETVERIETHISLIFLAGDVAYKIKKPVVFPFLDYSTPEARRRACVNEVQLNRRTALDLYLGVVPITYDKSRGLEIGGSGEVVEWAVKMRRFPDDALYSELAAAGRLGPEDYAELARAVHTFHDEAARRIEPGMATGALERLIAENDAAFAEYPDVFPPEDVRALRMKLEARLAELMPLLERRTRGGFVRHCHGDLHLRNVVRIESHPVLFDAVEFDDAIATVDVLDDLAFLLMDLIARGARQGANVALNAYLSADDDMRNLEGLAALPIYLSTRAGIRAKAAAYQAKSDEARRYFALAQDFIERSAPALIAIGGLSGTGKSTLARGLAPDIGAAPGAVILRSDMERKRLFAVAETQRLPESAYTAQVTETVYRTLAKKTRAALRAGHSVILDAVHGRQFEREDARNAAEETGAEFVGIWLTASEETLVARVESREADASDAGAAVVRKQLGFDPGEIAWARIDASGRPDEVRRRADDLLRKHGLRDS